MGYQLRNSHASQLELMWVRDGYLSSSKKVAKQWSDKCYATVNTLSSENGLMISLIMGYNSKVVGNKAKGPQDGCFKKTKYAKFVCVPGAKKC